jgi:hypothetical protein
MRRSEFSRRAIATVVGLGLTAAVGATGAHAQGIAANTATVARVIPVSANVVLPSQRPSWLAGAGAHLQPTNGYTADTPWQTAVASGKVGIITLMPGQSRQTASMQDLGAARATSSL